MPVYPKDRVRPFVAAKVVIWAEAYWVLHSEWNTTCASRSPRSVMATPNGVKDLDVWLTAGAQSRSVKPPSSWHLSSKAVAGLWPAPLAGRTLWPLPLVGVRRCGV
jgi:hypothetical protein